MSRRAAVLLPYAVFLILAAVSWNRWIEPFVDTGRELMVPWRVSRGEALYRDVRFYYGPLAPWLAAAVDSVAGRRFAARIALAALVAILHLEALRRLARRLTTETLASLAASLAVAVAFFLRPGGCHLFPYSLDTSLAVAAATGAVLLATSGGSSRRDRAAAACLLAALLARPEIGLAGLGAITVERVLASDAAAKRRLGWLVALPVLAAAIVYALASAGTPAATLAKEGWLAVLFVPTEFRNVYASFAGVDRPALRLAELGLVLFALLAVGIWLVLAAIAAARLRRRSEAGARAPQVAAVAILAVAALVALRPPAAVRETVDLLPPLVRAVPPLLFAAAIAGAALRLRDRSRNSFVAGVPDSVLLLALLFAARLLLAAGYVGPYDGFYLPLPIVVAVAMLFRVAARVPAQIDVSPRPTAFPGLVAASLAVFLAARIGALALAYRDPAWSRVATPAGSLFVIEPLAGATRDALANLSRRVPPNGSIVGFPEAGFFNWVLGRTNPLAQDQFFPGHLDRAGEQEAITRLSRMPPDAVVLVNVRTAGHGRAAFGKDYLEELDGYVRSRFRPAAEFGPGAGSSPRIGDPGFFIQILVPAGRPAP